MRFLLTLAFMAGSVCCTDFTQTVFGRSDVDGVPAAFGDFNSDELTDIFMLRDNFRTIQVGHPRICCGNIVKTSITWLILKPA